MGQKRLYMWAMAQRCTVGDHPLLCVFAGKGGSTVSSAPTTLLTCIPRLRPHSNVPASFPGSGLIPRLRPHSKAWASFPGSSLIPKRTLASFLGSFLLSHTEMPGKKARLKCVWLPYVWDWKIVSLWFILVNFCSFRNKNLIMLLSTAILLQPTLTSWHMIMQIPHTANSAKLEVGWRFGS